MPISFRWIVCLVLALGFYPSTPGGADENKPVELAGIGDSFAHRLYEVWIQKFNSKHPSIKTAYELNGLGSTILSFLKGKVDFAASDNALPQSFRKRIPGDALFVPVTAGHLVVAYNIEGIKSGELRLSRLALVGIFSGQISKWNDKLVKECNPKLALPDKEIKVVVRTDWARSSWILSKHLIMIAKEQKLKDFSWSTQGVPTPSHKPDWKIKSSRLVQTIGDGDMAQAIPATKNAIGYLEYSYAVKAQVHQTQLENHEGRYVLPTLENAAEALASIDLNKYPDSIVWILDPHGAKSYPLVAYTWIVVRKKIDDDQKRQALKTFLLWMLADGQQYSAENYCVPLPEKTRAIVKQRVESVLGEANRVDDSQ